MNERKAKRERQFGSRFFSKQPRLPFYLAFPLQDHIQRLNLTFLARLSSFNARTIVNCTKKRSRRDQLPFGGRQLRMRWSLHGANQLQI